MPRVLTRPPAKEIVRPQSGGIGRVEVREEPRSKRPTKFRSIADILLRTRIEEE